MPRRGEDRGGRSLLDHQSGIHHGDPVADPRDHADVVADVEERHPLLRREVRDQLQHARLDRHVQSGGGFVEDHQPRPGKERHRDDDPLHLPAGELMRPAALHVDRQAHAGKDAGDLGLGRVTLGLAMRLESLVKLPADPHHRIQRLCRILIDHRDTGAPQRAQRLCVERGDLLVQHPQRTADPGAGRKVAQHGIGEGRLAAAAFADQPQRLARLQPKADPAQRRDRSARSGVVDRQVAGLEHRAHRSRSPSARRLQATTTEVIATAGTIIMCGKRAIMPDPSTTMPPQSGVGGGRPRPRKPRVPTRITV